MNRPVVKEAIVVEGRYDKNTLSQIVDALIIVTDGFQLYKNADTRRAISCAADCHYLCCRRSFRRFVS